MDFMELVFQARKEFRYPDVSSRPKGADTGEVRELSKALYYGAGSEVTSDLILSPVQISPPQERSFEMGTSC